MFVLPGLLLLVAVDLLRPQEYVAALRGAPLLHQSALLALVGLVVDLKLGVSKLRVGPHLVPFVLFLVWAVFTGGVRDASGVLPRVVGALIPFTLYFVVSHGAQSFRALEIVAALMLAVSLALAAVAVHQGFAPTACYRVIMDDGLKWIYDGRPCELPLDCSGEGAEPGADYDCEKVGLFGTSSVKGRVRFRGSLEDPNELALVLGLAMPFAFAFFERRRSLGRLLLLVTSVGLIGLATFLTQSRGGQLVFLAVLGIYFIKRVGVVKGGLTGTLFALPILLFGGRSGGTADASTMERIECWWVGMHLFVASPVLGVGSGNFTEYHYLTAHNSYILAAAEMGFPGLVLWTAVIYLSLKIPAAALQAELPPVAKTWALALLASMAGMVVGVTFLSFNYKDVLWLYVGLTGVLYGAIRRHAPEFRVDLGLRDLALVAAICFALVLVFIGYTGLKMGW